MLPCFISQNIAAFYDKPFQALDFELPHADTGRRGFSKEAMLRALLVMRCEGFSKITDLKDYLDNNRTIAQYCSFDITRELLSYWTYDRFLRQLDNAESKDIIVSQVRHLYELGIVNAFFIGLDSTPVAANAKAKQARILC